MPEPRPARPANTASLRPLDEECTAGQAECTVCDASFEGTYEQARNWFLTHTHDRIHDIRRRAVTLADGSYSPWREVGMDLLYLLDRLELAEHDTPETP